MAGLRRILSSAALGVVFSAAFPGTVSGASADAVRGSLPEDHLPADVLEVYRGKRNMWGNWVRNHVPQFQPLRHR